ncbi:UNVERIFIED_CONTAM: LRR receptor kinase BAK1 [Sesamum calycinum]|uniref:LRR receptor kinase BAK1 n=1 Tax=Sesamum calycinum TaxID=2727403 RepID=A0AAW2IUW6_9LAMI
MEPKLSDFGLARMLGMEESKVYTDVRGTIGYMDPEYMSNAKLTCASDIYSFGIVTLQLLSGQRVIELDLDARDQLTRKAKDVNMGKRPLTDFQDPRMKNVIDVDFESILQIAVLCVASSSTGRPTIDLVYEELEKALENTQREKMKREQSFLPTPPSKSQELTHV